MIHDEVTSCRGCLDKFKGSKFDVRYEELEEAQKKFTLEVTSTRFKIVGSKEIGHAFTKGFFA